MWTVSKEKQNVVHRHLRNYGDDSLLPTGVLYRLEVPLEKWRNGAKYSYAVSCMLCTLLAHHDWGHMCNNSEDVRTLERDDNVRDRGRQVRCDTVASSATYCHIRIICPQSMSADWFKGTSTVNMFSH